MNIPTIAAGTPNLSTLVSALQNNNLVNTLSGAGPYTVFAPTNSAFSGVNLPSNPTTLRNLLLYHVVPGRYSAADLLQRNGQTLTTVAGQPLRISVVNGRVVLNGTTTISQADIPANNGVIHVINSVLNPANVSIVPASIIPGSIVPSPTTNNWSWIWGLLLLILLILIIVWLISALSHRQTTY